MPNKHYPYSFTVNFTNEMAAELAKFAQKQDRSVTAQIRRFVKQGLENARLRGLLPILKNND